MFYFENFMRQGHGDLSTETAATNHLQQWHGPPKRDVSAQPVEGIMFRKDKYGKVMRASFSHRYYPYPSDDKSNHDHAQAQQLISTVCAVLPSSGLTRFWDTAGQSSVVMPMTVSDSQFASARVASKHCVPTEGGWYVFLGNRGIRTCLVAERPSSSMFYSWRRTLFASKHSTLAEGAQDMFVGEWCALNCPVAGNCATSLCLGASAPFISRGTETFMLSSQPKDVTLHPFG